MFLGHFAVALAAKKAAPSLSLGSLTLAAQWSDILWPALLLSGHEEVRIDPGNTVVTPLDFVRYPFSHSLMALALWALLLGMIAFFLSRSMRAALVMAGLVLSHWLLDWIVHRPDLPVQVSGGERFGLTLWNSLAATIAAEFLLLAGGAYLYLRTTRAQDRVGKWALWSLLGTLCAIYIANLASPPPPSTTAIAYVGIAGAVVFVLWSWWIDAHRSVTAA